MTDLSKLRRIRWGARGVLVLGVTASVVANVLHALDNPISQAIAAWPPLALLITIELISRVPTSTRKLAVGRVLATAVIAAIAAWVSYWHMAAVASRYGETDASPYLLPVSVDGLILVASICLVELGGRITAAETDGDKLTPPMTPPAAAPVFQYGHPIGPMPAPAARSKVDRPRKPQPTVAAKVVRAHERWPDATHAELAKRADVSLSTVKTYRPKREQINGNVPALVGTEKEEK